MREGGEARGWGGAQGQHLLKQTTRQLCVRVCRGLHCCLYQTHACNIASALCLPLPLPLPLCCHSLRESLSAPLSALRKAAREVGSAAADAKLGVVVDDFVDRFR